MRIIVGLGNPGERYQNTRHNVGFMFVDELIKVLNFPDWSEDRKKEALVIDHKLLGLLVKPQAFMNMSGRVVKRYVNLYKIHVPDIWVIHDDLDLPLGKYKVQMGKGPRVHYGVISIEEALRSDNFWRVRIGVDNRNLLPDGSRMSGEEYVLKNFTQEEKSVVEGVIRNGINDLVNRLKTD